MKALGIILIVLGIGMFIYRGVSYSSKKEVAKIGTVSIEQVQQKTIGWPDYAGAIAVAAGAFLVLSRKKKV